MAALFYIQQLPPVDMLAAHFALQRILSGRGRPRVTYICLGDVKSYHILQSNNVFCYIPFCVCFSIFVTLHFQTGDDVNKLEIMYPSILFHDLTELIVDIYIYIFFQQC